jgi:hypothetical protein
MALELSPSIRGQIVGMVKAGVAQRSVAGCLGISKGAVWRALRRENIHHSQESLPRNRPPPKLDSRDHRRLAQEIVAHPDKPWDYFARLFHVSPNTIRRIAHSIGFHKRIRRRKPYISPKNIAKRRQWEMENRDQDWRRIIFTDESMLEMGEDFRRQ